MVNHLDVEAILPVVVLQRAEAVGALGDDLLDALLLEQRDVLLGKPVEHVLVAQAAQAVAAARLVVAQDAPGDPAADEDLGDGQGNLAAARVEGAGAAHVEQVLGRSRLEGHGGDVALGPVGALRRSDAPRVAAQLDALEYGQQLSGNCAFISTRCGASPRSSACAR